MTRGSFIEKLPPILILHLKRFVYDGHGTKKVWKKIAYPLTLEIPLDVQSPTQRGPNPPKFQLFGGINSVSKLMQSFIIMGLLRREVIIRPMFSFRTDRHG
jgi:ubiquitin C-terminal hydrolase